MYKRRMSSIDFSQSSSRYLLKQLSIKQSIISFKFDDPEGSSLEGHIQISTLYQIHKKMAQEFVFTAQTVKCLQSPPKVQSIYYYFQLKAYFTELGVLMSEHAFIKEILIKEKVQRVSLLKHCLNVFYGKLNYFYNKLEWGNDNINFIKSLIEPSRVDSLQRCIKSLRQNYSKVQKKINGVYERWTNQDRIHKEIDGKIKSSEKQDLYLIVDLRDRHMQICQDLKHCLFLLFIIRSKLASKLQVFNLVNIRVNDCRILKETGLEHANQTNEVKCLLWKAIQFFEQIDTKFLQSEIDQQVKQVCLAFKDKVQKIIKK